MPSELYLVRPIHGLTGRPCPGERLWSAGLLTMGPAVGFLRARNREGFDIYLSPFAIDRNAGYILVDLDRAGPRVVHTMRTHGHEPCVVLQTSPGNLQAWVHVSATPLEPALATEIGRELARLYRGDPASVDWRHLGRLAGFTNQKPQRRRPGGSYAPWVKLLHAQAGLATHGAALVDAAQHRLRASSGLPRPARSLAHRPRRRSHLSGLVELVADSTTISADRLEYRRQVDRQGVAVPQNTAGPSASYPPTGQPWLSPPPFRPWRLPAPHRRPSPRRARKAAFSRATPSPMRLPDSLHAPCVQAGRRLHLFPRLRWLGEALDGRRAGSLTWHSRHVPLKVRRRPISQGRVHPFTVVVISHEFLDMFGEFLEIPILVAVDLFLLQRFHEAFTERVVIGIGRAAHARDHSVGLEFRYVIGAGVLDPLVGVMDNTRWWLPFSDGLP